MSPRELPQGQIIPAAKPVDAFIAPANPQAAAPARPELMPRGPQMNVIAQGNGGNVQGYNNAEELAIALRPFNANLVNMTANIGQLYASSEYEKGRNEVVKAQILNNQQTLQSMGQYAADNRALAVKDPIAGLMMDSVNPYRRAGRENQISQIAAREVRTSFLDAYRSLGNPEQLDANSPQLVQARSQAIQRVMDKFGLNAGSAGFYDYVMPQINQAWDGLVKQHWEDRQNYLKSTIPGTKQAEILGMFADAKTSGHVEWTEYDPATGRPMQFSATPAQGALWNKGLITKAAQLLDGIRNEAGLPGQNSELQIKTIEGLLAVTQGNDEMRRTILSMPFGPPDAQGRRHTVAETLGPQVLDVDIRYGQYFRQQQEYKQKDGIERYSNEIAAATAGLPDGPEKAAAIAQIDAKPEYQGLPLIKRLGAQKETTSLVEDVTRRSYDIDGMDRWMQDQRAKYGTQWNARAADGEFERALQTYVPPDKRGEYRKQWGQLRAQKEEDKTKYPTSLLNPAIASAIKANLAAKYPQDATEAAMRGMDITQMMSYGKANVAESARRQNEAYQTHVRNRLAEEEGKLGRRLTEPEIISATNKAIREYGKDNKDAFNYLFPGVGHTPGIGGPAAGNAPADMVKPIPGRVPQSTPRYDAGQLDYIPNRDQRLQNWKNEAVMDKGSALSEVQSVLNGGALGAAVIRAARGANVDPATFVLQQLDFYPGNEGLSNDARQEFVRKVHGVKGLQTSFNNIPAPDQRNGYIAKGGSWLMDVLMGTTPAAAAEAGNGYGYMPRAGGGGRNVAFDVAANGNDYGGLAKLISSGEGGFNSVNYGSTRSAGRLNLTEMSIGQVEKLQAAGKVSAVGFAQWMPRNLAKARKAAGLSPDAPMSANNQIGMFWAYVLKSNKQPALRNYLTGASNNLNAAHHALAGEWAAIQGPNGRGRYDGDSAGNYASIDYRRVREALIRARQAILGGRG